MEHNNHDEEFDKDIIKKLLTARDAILPDKNLLHKIIVTTKTPNHYLQRGAQLGRPSFFIRLIDHYHTLMSSTMKIGVSVLALVVVLGLAAYYTSGPKPQNQGALQNQNNEAGSASQNGEISKDASLQILPATGKVDDIIAQVNANIASEGSFTVSEENDVAEIDSEGSGAGDFGQVINENDF